MNGKIFRIRSNAATLILMASFLLSIFGFVGWLQQGSMAALCLGVFFLLGTVYSMDLLARKYVLENNILKLHYFLIPIRKQIDLNAIEKVTEVTGGGQFNPIGKLNFKSSTGVVLKIPLLGKSMFELRDVIRQLVAPTKYEVIEGL